MTLALALIFIVTCAFYVWRTISTPPLDYESGSERGPGSRTARNSFMSNNDDKLERVAAKLDDISETLEEIKTAVVEGGDSSKKLDGVQKDVQRAADAIDEAVDPG